MKKWMSFFRISCTRMNAEFTDSFPCFTDTIRNFREFRVQNFDLPKILISAAFIFLLTACTTKPVKTYIPSENIEEIVIPQVEEDVDISLPQPFSGTVSLVGNKPVLYRGKDESWDKSLISPGAVIYHGGLYHFFYNGMTISSGLDGGGVGYALSTNGRDWYRLADAPLFTWDETVGGDKWFRVTSVLVDEEGIWTLYFSSGPRKISEETAAILRATASAPNGPWEFDEISLLEAGGAGAWDHYGVQRPVVLKRDDGYLMYYLNQRLDNRRGISGIGMATSPDGLSWTKYNDPNTDGEFEESDVVFTLPEGSMGFQEIRSYRVWEDENGFGMLYVSGGGATNNWNYASSLDGVTWTYFDENPILTADEIPFLSLAIVPEMLYMDGKYLFYFYGAADRNRPDGSIYLVESE